MTSITITVESVPVEGSGAAPDGVEIVNETIVNETGVIASRRKFAHGDRARDTVTGFVGVVTGYADYITGTARYGLTPISKPDRPPERPEDFWFDEERLELASPESSSATRPTFSPWA